MKWMFKFVFLAAALWGGYWFFGARAQEKIYAELLAESRNQGWTAESRNLGVSGFPNRFDTTLTGLNFRDPSGRWGWRGDEFQIKALSYKPNHIIMAWPGEQVVDTPQGDISVNADMLRASLVVSPSVNLPLSRFQIEGKTMALGGSLFGVANIGGLNGALFQDQDRPTKYHLGVDITDITLPHGLPLRLGGPIDSLNLSAYLEFDREIDRLALNSGQAPPRPVSANIDHGVIVWGNSELAITGTLTKSDNGYVDGQLDFNVKNWQPLFEAFKQMSHLTSPELLTLKRALNGASGGANLVFSLTFANGESRIGPFTIGPAPVYPF